MRGKDKIRYWYSEKRRITPAHAGKSCSSLRTSPQSWDHPRTCGEKLVSVVSLETIPGSPPHMRGKVDGKVVDKHSLGITPAHAGKRFHAAFTTFGS